MDEQTNPSPQAIAAHLRMLEETLLSPAIRRARARVSALLAPDFFEFGASGRVWSREQILDLLATETYMPPAVEDFHCTLLTAGVALVTYRSVRVDTHSGTRSESLRSSLWQFHEGHWRMRFHQGTRAL